MNRSIRLKLMVSYELRWIYFGASAENVVGYTVMDGIIVSGRLM